MENIKFALIGAIVLIIGVMIVILLKKDSAEEVAANSDSKVKAGRIKGFVNEDEFKLPNYNEYVMSKSEKLLWSMAGIAALFIVGYIFYRSIILSCILAVLGLYYPKFRRKQIIKKRREDLSLQFKDALYAISSSLSAGKSVASSFSDALNDLSYQYEDPETMILQELQYIIRKINLNETVEDALNDFADRSGLDDVKSFADVFTICTRTGGDLKMVLKNSSDIIKEKMEIKQDIKTLLTGKKLEGKVLGVAPIGMILFLSCSSPDFMEPVFHSQGRVVMTIAMILITIGAYMSYKIVDIEV